MRIWTYKNADEKAHTFPRRSKNVKNRRKRLKNGYCVNSPLPFASYEQINPNLPNFANKNKGTTHSRKVPNSKKLIRKNGLRSI